MFIKIYLLSAADTARLDHAQIQQILPTRWERASRYRLDSDRLLCLAAGHLFIGILGIRSEDELLYDDFGKPYIERPPSFSISHSGKLCVLAVGSGRIGCDIEYMNPRNLACAPSVLTRAELNWMAGDTLTRFHTLWTRKEALVKAAGTGRFREPADIEVPPVWEGATLAVSDTRFYMESRVFDRYCLSVCAEEPIDDIVMENALSHFYTENQLKECVG